MDARCEVAFLSTPHRPSGSSPAHRLHFTPCQSCDRVTPRRNGGHLNELEPNSWVVYTSIGRMGAREVCTQDKWERMTTAQPCYYILIRGSLPTREEAERVARGSDRHGLPGNGKSDAVEPLWWMPP